MTHGSGKRRFEREGPDSCPGRTSRPAGRSPLVVQWPLQRTPRSRGPRGCVEVLLGCDPSSARGRQKDALGPPAAAEGRGSRRRVLGNAGRHRAPTGPDARGPWVSRRWCTFRAASRGRSVEVDQRLMWRPRRYEESLVGSFTAECGPRTGGPPAPTSRPGVNPRVSTRTVHPQCLSTRLTPSPSCLFKWS